MLRDRKLAVFIDVDNAALDSEHYARIINQIRAMGEIVCAGIYNASERKHKMVIEDARQHGYSIMLSATGRRRTRKAFDNRIFVDVATVVTRNTVIDAVAIISGPADLVYLFSYLRRLGIQVVSGNNLDDQSSALVSERLDLGVHLSAKPAPRPPLAAKSSAKSSAKSAPARNTELNDDKTAELLRQIERLRSDYESAPKREEPKRPARRSEPNIADETRNLIDRISELHDEHEGIAEDAGAPRAVYVSQNDSDLIRRIEELRKQNAGNESDKLIAEIKKLLDGLE